MSAEDVKLALQKHASDSDALFLQRFFKTGEGQYGEGDVFIGVRVPMTRKVCKEFKDLPLTEIKKLIFSPVHEHRLAGLIILANRYAKEDEANKKKVFDLYMDSLYAGQINNWDLVDVTVEQVVGAHLLAGSRSLLFELAKSPEIWQRRVAIVATFAFIKKGDASTTLEIAEVLLKDKHDLIQKAVGWMLREIGKRVDEALLRDFLDTHAHEMPRTMLRYSLERLAPEQKRHYMQLKRSF